MSIQQLQAQLEQMGISGGFGATSGDIASQLTQHYGLEGTPLTSALFQEINPNLVKSASIGAYSPLIQHKQGAITTDLIKSLSGGDVKKSYGGFAGTGGVTQARQGARDVYGRGMGEAIGQARAAQTHALQTLQNILGQWKETAQSFVGPEMQV